MARRIYLIIMIISLALGIYLYTTKDSHTTLLLVSVSSLFFFLFSIGIHGLLAHSIKPSDKGTYIVYPILMGALWAVLFGVFLFLILPLFCPDFNITF